MGRAEEAIVGIWRHDRGWCAQRFSKKLQVVRGVPYASNMRYDCILGLLDCLFIVDASCLTFALLRNVRRKLRHCRPPRESSPTLDGAAFFTFLHLYSRSPVYSFSRFTRKLAASFLLYLHTKIQNLTLLLNLQFEISRYPSLSSRAHLPHLHSVSGVSSSLLEQ